MKKILHSVFSGFILQVCSFTRLNNTHKQGQVAQLVEQRTENPRVGGSIPSLTTVKIFFQTRMVPALRVFCVFLPRKMTTWCVFHGGASRFVSARHRCRQISPLFFPLIV